MSKIKKTDHTKSWSQCGATTNTAYRNVKWYNDCGKQSGSFLNYKAYTYHMVYPFHYNMFPYRNESIHPQKDLYINVQSSLIAIAPNQKQPKNLHTGEWINKLWLYPYQGILTIKRKSIIDTCDNYRKISKELS